MSRGARLSDTGSYIEKDCPLSSPPPPSLPFFVAANYSKCACCFDSSEWSVSVSFCGGQHGVLTVEQLRSCCWLQQCSPAACVHTGQHSSMLDPSCITAGCAWSGSDTLSEEAANRQPGNMRGCRLLSTLRPPLYYDRPMHLTLAGQGWLSRHLCNRMIV